MSPTTKARRLATILDRHRVPEVVTLFLCGGLAAFAIDMIANPATYDRPTFRVANEWFDPAAWGVLLLLPATATILAILARRRDLWWPLTAMAMWLTAWSAAAYLSAPGELAVNSAAIIYTTLTALTAFMAAVYMRESREL